MERYIFSDLAIETSDQTASAEGREDAISPCVKRISLDFKNGNIVTYITPPLFLTSSEILDEARLALSVGLWDFMKRRKTEASSFTVLVVGLGNGAVLSDSLGPRTLKCLASLGETNDDRKEGFRLLCLTPDVLANTGIKSVDLVRCVRDRMRPDLVLTVDALAAKSYSRLGAAVQLSELGVCPGSGVGNRRGRIDRETMGVPVISIGIPTVVRAATLVAEALRIGGIDEVTPTLKRYLQELECSFVTPKEVDWMVEELSYFLATVIRDACLLFRHK